MVDVESRGGPHEELEQIDELHKAYARARIKGVGREPAHANVCGQCTLAVGGCGKIRTDRGLEEGSRLIRMLHEAE